MSYRTDVMGHLTDEQWNTFCNQYKYDYKKAQRALNAARTARIAAEESIKVYLDCINRTKQSALKYGIDLNES